MNNTMYLDFYKFHEKPFNLTPSPRYVYLGDIHKEALALLTYGVVERKGFILLTGEVGTGKTTMVQALLSNLDENSQYVYLSNPLISPEEFMDYVAFSAFKKKVHFKSKAEFLIEFEVFLKECLQHQKNFLLIIDEAHKLSLELLEEVRLLSNMETADEKLINIFLVGQPELNDNLSQPSSRALLQRISVRYHIKPLDLAGTKEYINTRMKTAGSKDWNKIFPKNVVKTIFECSGGYPRVINVLSDNVLLLGYSREKRQITPAMVKECHQDTLLDATKKKAKSKKKKEHIKNTDIPYSRKKSIIRWPAIAFAIFIIILTMTEIGPYIVQRFFELVNVRQKSDIENVETAGKSEAPSEKKQNTTNTLNLMLENGKTKKEEQKVETENAARSEEMLANNIAETTEKSENIFSEDRKANWKTLTVKEGDTLTGMAAKEYGLADQTIINLLKKHNPEMRDINWISVGQKIVFPPLNSYRAGLTYTVHIASYKPFAYASELFQKLIQEGYEAYIIPINDPEKGKIFRVTVGSFQDRLVAEESATKIMEKGVSDYARTIQVQMR